MIKRQTVLLIEDNPADALLTTEAFENVAPSVDVEIVQTGEDALTRLLSDPIPDLVLLDLNLPGLSGHEVLRRLRTDDRLKALPVVVLSSSRATTDVTDAYFAAANSYLRKPLGPTEFDDLIRELSSYWFELVELP